MSVTFSSTKSRKKKRRVKETRKLNRDISTSRQGRYEHEVLNTYILIILHTLSSG